MINQQIRAVNVCTLGSPHPLFTKTGNMYLYIWLLVHSWGARKVAWKILKPRELSASEYQSGWKSSNTKYAEVKLKSTITLTVLLLSHTVTSALGLLQEGHPVLFVRPRFYKKSVQKGILKTSSGNGTGPSCYTNKQKTFTFCQKIPKQISPWHNIWHKTLKLYYSCNGTLIYLLLCHLHDCHIFIGYTNLYHSFQ